MPLKQKKKAITTQQNQNGVMMNISSGNSVMQPAIAPQTQTNVMTAHQIQLAQLKKELGEIKKPSVLMTQQFDASVYKESIGADKRQKKITNRKSRLFQKECNASILEEAEYSCAMLRESAVKFVAAQRNGAEGQATLLSAFFGEETAQNVELVSDYEDQGKRSEVIVKCLQMFQKTDLSQIDVRDDGTLVKHAEFLEQLSAQAQAMKEMITESDFGSSSDTEQNQQYREKFEVTYETVSVFVNYYQIKKQIMKHPYYRSHYNTEISMRHSEQDSIEQRELTFLLWQAQACLEKLGVSPASGSVMRLKDDTKEEQRNHLMLQNYLRERAKKQVVSEKIPQELKNDEEKYHAEICKQVGYLEWKYGDRFLLLSPEEMLQGFDSIQKDFAPLQEMSDDMEALQKTAAAFGNTEENRILRRKLSYYTGVWKVEQRMYQELVKEPDMSYAQYRRKIAEYASDLSPVDVQASMQPGFQMDLTRKRQDYQGQQLSGEKKLSRTEAYHDYLTRREFIKKSQAQKMVLPKAQPPEVTEKKIGELDSVFGHLKELMQQDLLLTEVEKEERIRSMYRAYEAELEHYIDQNRSLTNQVSTGTALSKIEKDSILSKLEKGKYGNLFAGYKKYRDRQYANAGAQTIVQDLEEHMKKLEDLPKELPKEVDDGLSEEQIAGIHAIDQWMFRNMVHDGLTGSTKERYVCELMKKPLRERLLSYYIVEKGQYKNPNAATTVCSQTGYIPDLNAFKNRMVATKFKFWRRRNGGQIYWGKLDLAFEYASQNRNMVHTYSLAKQEEQKLKKSQMIQPLQKKALERQKKYEQFLQYAAEYREFLERSSEASRDQKPLFATQKQAFARMIQISLRELVQLDKEFPKERLKDADERFSPEKEEEQTLADDVFETVEKVSDPADTIFSNGQWISTQSDPATLFSWNLSETKLAKMNLTAGILGTVAGVAAIAECVVKVRELGKKHKEMEKSEFAQAVAEIVNSSLGGLSTLGTNISLMSMAGTYAAVYNEVAKSAATEIISNVARVMTGASAAIQITSSCYDLNQVHKGKIHLESAKQLLQSRNQARQQQSQSEKEKRHEEYEQGILKLAGKQLNTKKIKALYNIASNGIAATGAIGGMMSAYMLEAAADLASIGISICGSVHEYLAIQSRNEKMVDDYLKVDEVLESLGKKNPAILQEKNKGIYRKQVRKELLARFGFSGTASFFAHVAKKYASYLYQKLFYTENGEKLTNAEYEKHKDEYAPYVEVAKGLRLRVKYPETADEKPRPSEDAILEKLT